MALTPGQGAVLERSDGRCEYSAFHYQEYDVPGSAPHHCFGRARSDDPRHILCLSYELHVALHRSLPDSRGNPVTKERCIAVLRSLYDNWEGLDETISKRSRDDH